MQDDLLVLGADEMVHDVGRGCIASGVAEPLRTDETLPPLFEAAERQKRDVLIPATTLRSARSPVYFHGYSRHIGC